MSNIQLNNQNKIQFNFSYDHGLPYKKSIRPHIKYGDWKNNPNKTLIKILLSEKEYALFNNPYDISGLSSHLVGSEIWFDLIDVYLVFSIDNYLQKRILEKNILLAFVYNNNVISSLSI